MGALGMAETKVIPAAAATGGSVQLGNSPAPNVADAPTTIQTTGALPRVFGAMAAGFTQANLDAAGTFSGPLQGLGTTTGTIEGVDGWAQGASSWAVYGLTDSGTGVVGESNTGIGLYARRSGRIRQEGRPAGAPTYSPNLFEQVRDVNGVLWVHGLTQVAGSTNQGLWRRVNSLRFDTADGTGGFFKPYRVVDTRNSGAPKPSATTWSFTIPPGGGGASSIPPDAIGVVGNLTAVNYNNVGFLTIFPAGVAYNPSTDPSSLNLIPGAGAVANAFIVGLGTGSQVSVFIGTPGTSHFIIDITGYIQ
jgi:hypothetical protein